MKASGVAILYISHHLEEIYKICDRATVLRDGRHIVTAPVAELDHERLVTAMVGNALAQTIREQSSLWTMRTERRACASVASPSRPRWARSTT